MGAVTYAQLSSIRSTAGGVMIPGGDEQQLLEIWRRLDDAGARKIHVFLPDMIVCSVPADVDARSAAYGRGVLVRTGHQLEPRDASGLRVSPLDIHRRYVEKQARIRNGAPAPTPPPGCRPQYTGRADPPLDDIACGP